MYRLLAILFVIQMAFGLPANDNTCDCGKLSDYLTHVHLHFFFHSLFAYTEEDEKKQSAPFERVSHKFVYFVVVVWRSKVHFRVENELVLLKNNKNKNS